MDPRGLDAGREALRRFLASEESSSAMLQTIARLATEAVAGVDLASITMVRDGIPVTPVYTDEVALRLDEKQYEESEGPCLAAIRHRGVVQLDIASDEVWPPFTAVARELGVKGVLSAALVRGETAIGALNLYSRTTSTLDEATRETASLFADQLGVAAANATAYAEGFELAQQLREAMESRAVIEQAKGIIIAAAGCTPDEAFDLLRRQSQNENRKVREIASELVLRQRR